MELPVSKNTSPDLIINKAPFFFNVCLCENTVE